MYVMVELILSVAEYDKVLLPFEKQMQVLNMNGYYRRFKRSPQNVIFCYNYREHHLLYTSEEFFLYKTTADNSTIHHFTRQNERLTGS